MNYITVTEASEKWNITTRRICILCNEGRIAGAIKKSRVWMIPENAKKPEDGRKTEIKKGIEPAVLLLNPTYFENNSIEPLMEEKIICDIQKKYISGQLEDAYDEINKSLSSFQNHRYDFLLLILKAFVTIDLGKIDVHQDTIAKMYRLMEGDIFPIEKMLLSYYFGHLEYFDEPRMLEAYYDELMPMVSLIIIKKGINIVLKEKNKIDVSALEILCREISNKKSPLITAYCHLYLAMYYNIVGVKKLFEYHYKEATSILIPRKWYTPLAEYSATVNLELLAEIDKEAYQNVVKISEIVIKGFVKAGLFDKLVVPPRLNIDINIQIGYKLFQGKNIEEIAKELGLSQYKVKQHLDDLCAMIGASSKKEIREFMQNNIFV